uniref:Uncharacterized protein n=1 Tax=Caenorhabditis japonica TaxID=281687 RepID=A0A8R1II66_CAEJA
MDWIPKSKPVSMLSTLQDWSKAAPGSLVVAGDEQFQMPNRTMKNRLQCHLLHSLCSRRNANTANKAIIKSSATHAVSEPQWIVQLRINIKQLHCQLPYLENRTCPAEKPPDSAGNRNRNNKHLIV